MLNGAMLISVILRVIVLCVIRLCVVILTVIMFRVTIAECRYTESYASRQNAEFAILRVIMFSESLC
jgi:hypothetical protein